MGNVIAAIFTVVVCDFFGLCREEIVSMPPTGQPSGAPTASPSAQPSSCLNENCLLPCGVNSDTGMIALMAGPGEIFISCPGGVTRGVGIEAGECIGGDEGITCSPDTNGILKVRWNCAFTQTASARILQGEVIRSLIFNVADTGCCSVPGNLPQTWTFYESQDPTRPLVCSSGITFCDGDPIVC